MRNISNYFSHQLWRVRRMRDYIFYCIKIYVIKWEVFCFYNNHWWIEKSVLEDISKMAFVYTCISMQSYMSMYIQVFVYMYLYSTLPKSFFGKQTWANLCTCLDCYSFFLYLQNCAAGLRETVNYILLNWLPLSY